MACVHSQVFYATWCLEAPTLFAWPFHWWMSLIGARVRGHVYVHADDVLSMHLQSEHKQTPTHNLLSLWVHCVAMCAHEYLQQEHAYNARRVDVREHALEDMRALAAHQASAQEYVVCSPFAQQSLPTTYSCTSAGEQQEHACLPSNNM